MALPYSAIAKVRILIRIPSISTKQEAHPTVVAPVVKHRLQSVHAFLLEIPHDAVEDSFYIFPAFKRGFACLRFCVLFPHYGFRINRNTCQGGNSTGYLLILIVTRNLSLLFVQRYRKYHINSFKKPDSSNSTAIYRPMVAPIPFCPPYLS